MGSIETQEVINEALQKINELYKQVGNSVTTLMLQRIREGKATPKNIESDLKRLMDAVPPEMQAEIYKSVIVSLTCAVGNTSINNKPVQKNVRSNQPDNGYFRSNKRGSLFN